MTMNVTREKRLKMKLADSDMCYLYRFQLESERRARIRAGNRSLALVAKLGPESRAKWTGLTMAARNRAARVTP